MINKQQAIDLVNKDIRKTYQDPEYRVYYTREYDWGWLMDWMPDDPNKIIYGSSVYMVHKNGFMSTWNEIAFDSRLFFHSEDIIEVFIKKAKEVLP